MRKPLVNLFPRPPPLPPFHPAYLAANVRSKQASISSKQRAINPRIKGPYLLLTCYLMYPAVRHGHCGTPPAVPCLPPSPLPPKSTHPRPACPLSSFHPSAPSGPAPAASSLRGLPYSASAPVPVLPPINHLPSLVPPHPILACSRPQTRRRICQGCAGRYPLFFLLSPHRPDLALPGRWEVGHGGACFSMPTSFRTLCAGRGSKRHAQAGWPTGANFNITFIF